MTHNNHDEYYNSYSQVEVHNVMLRDAVRLETYKKAIFSNESFWKEKTVLDVGAGTGILSLYCAKAGATKVYAVEASGIASVMEEVIKENSLQHIIEVVKGCIEDVQIPCLVDIIISEWMGHYLFHEGMLDSILFARDKYLKKEGLIFPESCKLYASPCALPSYFDNWYNLTGVNMKPFATKLRQSCQEKPEIVSVEPEMLLCEKYDCPVYEFDLYSIKQNDLDEINTKFFVVSTKDGKYQGVCIWFDVCFPTICDNIDITLSTAPNCPLTHWKQTVIVFPDELVVEEGDPIAGAVIMRRDKINSRRYNISFDMLDSKEVTHPTPCDCNSIKCVIIKHHELRLTETNENGSIENNFKE